MTRHERLVELSDIPRLLLAEWRLIFGPAIVSCLVAIGICAFIPKKYEATVLVKIGKISHTNLRTNSAEIEPIDLLIERLNGDGFRDKLRSLGLADPSLRGSTVRGANLVRLTTISYSRHEALKQLEYAVKILTEEHKNIHETSIEHLTHSLAVLRKLEASMVEESLKTPQRGSSTNEHILDPDSGRSFSRQYFQVFLLANKITELSGAITENRLNQTGAIDIMRAPVTPVYPKTQLVATIAFILGGFLGVTSAFLMHSWRRS